MKHVLLPASTIEKFTPQLEAHAAQLKVFAMQDDGSISHNGTAVAADGLDINYGWLNNDVIENGITRPYAITLLKSENLEWMQSMSAGLDDPFFKMLMDKGIRLSNSDAQSPAIAEYVLASVLNRYHNFELRKHHQNDKQWQDVEFKEILNSNWLIIGLGKIGTLTADRAQAFGANITGVKRDKRKPNKHTVINFDDIKAALPEQDVVVLACALTEDTKNLVDNDFLNQMKKDAVIVNIGRGQLIDESALLEALSKDKIDCAVLDVFQTEPLPKESPFWHHNKVIMTPHASHRGSGTIARGEALFLHNLNAILTNQPLKNEVDTEAYR